MSILEMNQDCVLMKKETLGNRKISYLSRNSIADRLPEISNEHRKTLMISEQDNFILLKRCTPTNFPRKKYKALVPHEYTKYILKSKRINLRQRECNIAKYAYPSNILSNSEIEKLKSEHSSAFFDLKSSCYNSIHERLHTIH